MFNNKIAVAAYIFENIVSKEELAGIENTRLMKYLYLVNFTYLVDNNHYDTPANTLFSDFKYTAYQNGPVEEYIYSYLQDIRSAILQGTLDGNKILKIIGTAKPQLDAAIAKVKDNFSERKTSWLIDFTHCILTEWSRTPLFGEMTFDSGGYRTECRALRDYYSFLEETKS